MTAGCWIKGSAIQHESQAIGRTGNHLRCEIEEIRVVVVKAFCQTATVTQSVQRKTVRMKSCISRIHPGGNYNFVRRRLLARCDLDAIGWLIVVFNGKVVIVLRWNAFGDLYIDLEEADEAGAKTRELRLLDNRAIKEARNAEANDDIRELRERTGRRSCTSLNWRSGLAKADCVDDKSIAGANWLGYIGAQLDCNWQRQSAIGIHNDSVAKSTTPFDMVVLNNLDRYQLALDAIRRIPRLADRIEAETARFDATMQRHKLYIGEHGDDMPEVRDWRWTL